MDEKMDELAARVSIADISTAVTLGVQRALQRRDLAEGLADKILRYGGRLEFTVEILPAAAKGIIEGGQIIREG